MRIFKVFFVLLLAGFISVTASVFDRHIEVRAQEALYYCPMHPKVTSDRKGSCPVCGMDLVRRKEEAVQPKKPALRGPSVDISPERQQLIGVGTSKVMKRPLERVIPAAAEVQYDPGLLAVQEEYLRAREAAVSAVSAQDIRLRQQAEQFAAAARQKLVISGMGGDEIRSLEAGGKPEDPLQAEADDSVTVVMVVYENDLSSVVTGALVDIEAPAFAGEKWQGHVTGISGVIDRVSRSVRVRARVVDQKALLKPGMFLNAGIRHAMGQRLAVPAGAVLYTGQKTLVYLVSGQTFEAREVSLGSRAGDYYEVVDGLSEGDMVVTSGNFLVDAETRIRGTAEPL